MKKTTHILCITIENAHETLSENFEQKVIGG